MILNFSIDDNFDAYDSGLMTFIASGPGEEWRLVTVTPGDQWCPNTGWQVVNITLDNMAEYMPRLGYLFTDRNFDIAKVFIYRCFHNTILARKKVT